jgi:hypothetical protein
MRPSTILALLSLTVVPGIAAAQDAPPPGPTDGGPGLPSGHWHHHDKQGWAEKGGHDWSMGGPEMLDKFYNANTSHDGHLTLAQAKAANLRSVADHFDAIDTQHRGYVTFNDIEAWHLDDMAKHLEQRAAMLRSKD